MILVVKDRYVPPLSIDTKKKTEQKKTRIPLFDVTI